MPLAAFNHISPDTLLQIGQELLIGPPTATPEPTTTPTPTTTPELVNLAAAASPIITSSPVATAVMITPKEDVVESTGFGLGNVLGIGAMIAGLALAVLAGVAILIFVAKRHVSPEKRVLSSYLPEQLSYLEEPTNEPSSRESI